MIVIVVIANLILAAPARAWPPDIEKAERYARSRQGSVSLAVIGPSGGRHRSRAFTGVPAASVIKVMFMAAYLRTAHGRELTQADKKLLYPMITRSANEPATQIANMLGPRRIYRLARDAGMDHFQYRRPWGLSTVNAAEQAAFMHSLEEFIPRRHEDYARWLLSHIVDSQRWGIGELSRPNWKFFFKGGWGSGTGAVCHQVAFLERDDMQIAVAVMITNSPSHDYATDTLKGVFKILLGDLPKP